MMDHADGHYQVERTLLALDRCQADITAEKRPREPKRSFAEGMYSGLMSSPV